MIYLLLIYLLFIIGYEHWGDNSVTSKVIYFAFQYWFIGAVSIFQWVKSGKIAFIFFAVIFFALTVNELMCIGFDNLQYQEAVNGDLPVFGLTTTATALFIIYEIIRWKKKEYA